MKTKITLLALLFIGLNLGFAQQDEECMTKLSIFHEYTKAKNYDAAYEPWMAVRNKCPKFNNAIYVDGEKILEHKIDNSTGAEKVGFINDLLKLWEQRAEHFASKTPKGEYAAKACQLMYDNQKELGKTKEELYECFDNAYKLDKETFTNPKSIYTYFSLMVDLYDADKKPAAELFSKYDDIVDKIEGEVKNYSEKLNKLIEKDSTGASYTSKEKNYKRYYENYLKNYDLISGNVDAKLGTRANCENLIPLYEKSFEANKDNVAWLQGAMNLMYQKECTDDPMFVKIVEQKNSLAPDASTAFYVGLLKDKEGKTNEAIDFFEQAISLETDSFKKSKLYYKIATKLKAKGSYGKARNYYRQALKLNPSNGRPYLAIAAMYAASANNCGETTFDKRAVYWLAAQEAKKASRVDPTLSKAAAQSAANYEAKAPSKSDVFSSGRSGETISIGCWIGASVKVPSI
ncbi:tetratricopeptide repeat protein [Tamlana crocina]|uniref:Tetratricopeptide repeat protein n=1 Tax=Tamlana crocina TaxID=393006 RepID=A0ABX1DCX7_9FLAO|nr:tetratricopeptide repeat protein [Tamlana crocina]NJX16210.1 tetratricopeptide repeat protein [Tamlana crocina]